MAVSQDVYDSQFRELICSLIWPDEELAARPVHMAAINPTSAHLDYMRQVFPSCKFVGLIRHGVEVVSSRTEYASFSQQDFVSHCETWNRSADVFLWGQQHLDCFQAVRHEWFYDPEKLEQVMSNLFRWLGIDHFEAPLLQMLGALRHPTSAQFEIKRRDFGSTEIEDRRRYFQSKRERWKSWTSEQITSFEQLCEEKMQALGYEIPWMS